MFGIAVNNLRALFVGVVLHVVNGHCRDATIRRWLHEIAFNDCRNAGQRCERQPYRPARYVRPRQTFEIHIGRRFFVEPEEIEGFALEAFTASKVALDTDGRDAADSMSNLDAVEQVRNTARCYQLDNRILRNGASAFLPRTTNEQALHRVSHGLARRAGNPRNGWFVETLSLPP